MSLTDTPAAKPAPRAPKHRAVATPRRTPATSATAGKRRGAHAKPASALVGRRVRRTAALTGVAGFATALAVGGGMLSAPASVVAVTGHLSAAVPGAGTSTLSADAVAARARPPVSRSDRRDTVDRDKAQTLAQTDGPAVTRSENIADEDARTIAQALLAEFGFSPDQFSCLDPLWAGESGWRTTADNPNSSAYGIPQALPGSKMSSAGSDWATSAVTQIRWGLGYIRDRYGSPCGAWGFKQGHGWY